MNYSRRTKALVFILGPFILTILIDISYVFVNTFFNSVNTSVGVSILTVINFVLGLLGFIAVISFLIGLPVGIYLLVNPDKQKKLPAKKNITKQLYSRLEGLGLLTVVFQAVTLGIVLIAIISDLSQISLLQTISTGAYVSDSEVATSDSIQNFVGEVQLLFWLIAFVIFLIWFHKAYANLSALKKEQKTTAGWAVLDFFIPFLNFFEPYKRIKEIWRGTFGADDEKNVLIIWWICFLGSSVLTRLGSSLIEGGKSIDDIISAGYFILFGDLIFAITIILTIFIVKKITKAQDSIKL